MGNLTEIKRDLLFNSLSASKVGVYQEKNSDLAPTAKVLLFKDTGYAFRAEGEFGKEYGFIKADAIAGKVKVILCEINNLAPVNPNRYEEAVSIDPVRKNFGVDESNYLGDATYGGIYSVETSGGLISDDSLKLIIEDMGNQAFNHEDSYVTVGYGVTLSGWVAASTITLNGTPYAAASTIQGLVNNVNAGTIAYAYVSSNTTIAIVFRVPMVSITGNMTKGDMRLGIAAKSVHTSFNTSFRQRLVSSEIAQAPIFPFLTAAEIDSAVRNYKNAGDLTMFAPSERPIEGKAYSKYIFWASSDGYEQHTPGADIKHKKFLNIYVLSEIIDDDHWKSADWISDEIASPDKNFNELLAHWKS